MQAVSASTSAGSIAGNIPIRSWLRPSLRYGSTSTIPFSRSVAASAAASTASSKSIVPTTAERFAGSATNGVAYSLRLGPAVEVARRRRGSARRTSRGRPSRASSRAGRPAAAGSRPPACCRSGPCASSRARSPATGTRAASGRRRRRAPRSARSRPGSAAPATGRRRRRTPSAGRSSRRRPRARSTGRPPAPEVASTRTSASPASAGRSTGDHHAGRGLVVGPGDRVGGRVGGRRGRVARLGLDHDRLGQERRRRGRLRELARELAVGQVQGALAHQARPRRRPRTPSCRRCRARPRSRRGPRTARASPPRIRATRSLTGRWRCEVPITAAARRAPPAPRGGPSTGRSRSGRRRASGRREAALWMRWSSGVGAG